MRRHPPARGEARRGRGAGKPTPDPEVLSRWGRQERARKDGFIAWLRVRYAAALRLPLEEAV